MDSEKKGGTGRRDEAATLRFMGVALAALGSAAAVVFGISLIVQGASGEHSLRVWVATGVLFVLVLSGIGGAYALHHARPLATRSLLVTAVVAAITPGGLLLATPFVAAAALGWYWTRGD